MKNSKKAFTLIELLVVIAIIALLLSIIIPSLKKAKEYARTIICKNNLKQYGIAGTIYRSDNDDKFPWVYYWLHYDPPAKAAAAGTPLYCMWHDEDIEPDGQLWPYLDAGKVNLCPVFDSMARSGHAEDHVTCTTPMNPQFGYSMNSYLGAGMNPLGFNYKGDVVRASDITRNPSQVAFFGEESLWCYSCGGETRHILGRCVPCSRRIAQWRKRKGKALKELRDKGKR